MENINRNLLIECSPEANSKEVFDYLESKGENINPNYYKYATKTANTEWYFVGFNRTRKEWTVARKNHHSFYYTSVVLSKDFLGKTTSESYIGRTIKALVDNPNNTGLKKDETVKILLERLKTYVLDTTPKGNNGMIIQNPLDLSKWELVSDKVSVDTSISIPEYVECIEVPYGWNITKKGRIYKIDSFDVNNGYFRLQFDERDGKGGQQVRKEKDCFKPSSKEAYDAQFVATSSILPKKWCLKITSSNQEVLNKWRKRQPNFFEQSIAFTGWLLSDAHDGTYTHWNNSVPVGYTEITLQQFYDNVHPIDVYDIIKKESSVYVHDSYETVKTKPLIENVHSVSVKLSTKKINNKFKF